MNLQTHSGHHLILGKDQIGQLLQKYRPWCRVFVRQSLYGQLGRRMDESDVIQSTWVDLIRNMDQFRGETEAEFFSWLKVSLGNHLKNSIRDHMAEKRDVRREVEPVEMDSASLQWWEPSATGSSPSARLIKGESAIELAKSLESLPENQRVALELRYLQRMKLSEVCEQMGKTADAVVSLMRRGMQSLKNKT